MKIIFKDGLKKYKTMCVIGLAKNTGKTTTLNRLIKEAESIPGRIGILSTGRDGECVDVFTNKNKPRILARETNCFVTTEESLAGCEAKMQVLETLDYMTSMGKVVIAKVLTAGPIEIAGPASVPETLEVIKLLYRKYKVQGILIDGAINRVAIITSQLNAGIILATGAALGDLNDIIDQTRLKVNILQTPLVNSKIKDLILRNKKKGVILINKNLSVRILKVSLFQDVKGIVDSIDKEVKYLYTNGAISDILLEHLSQDGKGLELIVDDASKIHITRQGLKRWISSGRTLKVMNKVDLVAVTCNPYNPVGHVYEPKKFLKVIRHHLNVPVYDVMLD